MKYSFSCYGHKNITSKHKTTIEFTKDKDLGLEGDCIVGVKADFDLKDIKKFINSLKNNKKITITIEAINNDSNNNKENNINNKNKTKDNYNDNKIIEKINAEINPDFNSEREMVIRKSDFISDRTFAIKADKASVDLDKGLVKSMSSGKISVCIFD